MKGLIIKKHNHCLGWLPQEDRYVLLQNTTCPSDSEIFRKISYKPGCNLSNLPLSIFNLIHFTDKIGATDDCLLQRICSYLRKYRPNLLETIDQRKNSLHAVIESLVFQCTTDLKKVTVLCKLRNFSRSKSESFAQCFLRFEALHQFYIQIDKPEDADTIRLISFDTLRAIVPYLISSRCVAPR